MRLLLVEGNTRARVKQAGEKGIRSASGVYADAIHRFFPEVEMDL
jgi:hypothetical protein